MKRRILQDVVIESLGAKGKSIGKHPQEERILIVEGDAVPGDIVTAEVFKKRKNYLQARPTAYSKRSKHRVTPKCTHFGICGGCKWQQVDYDFQLASKEQEVLQTLKKVGSLEPKNIKPILGAPEIFRYRNKFEFSFSDSRWLTSDEISHSKPLDRRALGFHVPGIWHKIVAIDECWLQDSYSNTIRQSIFNFAKEQNYSFFNLREQTGLLRSLMMRTTSDGQIMILIQFAYEDKQRISELLSFINNTFEGITSLLYTINSKGNDTIYDLDIVCYSGKDHIVEQLEGVSIRIDAKSFYQTNILQTPRLYNAALALADFKPTDLVYDLYCGTGTISLLVAPHVQQVIGVEIVDKAVKDAIHNADVNGIQNASFYCGDMKSILNQDFVATHGLPNILIIDPPRDGIHADVIKKILMIQPEKVIYISCNPSTQARDLMLLAETYALDTIQAVDMFPHTAHVENIALLTLIK